MRLVKEEVLERSHRATGWGGEDDKGTSQVLLAEPQSGILTETRRPGFGRSSNLAL